ncbi:hypothetical protein [Cyclobacterium salsum]|uniref:hypothetical protein n=1 Tax=Cyclobacterium salsum TaxID=2666329 RepID=UPI001391C866|nr:hypothetical protein [Cyclobacterium salsum]
MQTHNLGYPRIGAKRELKKACEKYWSGQIPQEELVRTGWNIRIKNWRMQQEAGTFGKMISSILLTCCSLPTRK